MSSPGLATNDDMKFQIMCTILSLVYLITRHLINDFEHSKLVRSAPTFPEFHKWIKLQPMEDGAKELIAE